MQASLLAILTAHSVLAVVLVLFLIALDALLGVVKALATSTFSLAKLEQVAARHVFPQIGALMLAAVVHYFAAHALGQVMGMTTQGIFWAVLAAVGLSLLSDVLGKLGVKTTSGAAQLNTTGNKAGS